MLSSMMFSAMLTPTPTLLPPDAASAVVLLLPLWVAMASMVPTVNVSPLPILASVVLVTMVIAMVGLMPMSPAEPAAELVALLLSDVAVRVSAPTSLRVTLSPMEALAMLFSMSMAKDAPMPTLASPSCSALASVMVLVLFCASKVMSPPLTSMTAPLSMSALLAFVPM